MRRTGPMEIPVQYVLDGMPRDRARFEASVAKQLRSGLICEKTATQLLDAHQQANSPPTEHDDMQPVQPSGDARWTSKRC